MIRVALAVALAAGCGPAATPDPCAPAPRFTPWDQPAPVSRAPDVAGGAGDALVRGYQRHLRRPELPGGGCPFAPTCSVYARDAIAAYGPLGLVLAIDRLLVREHAGLHGHYPVDCADGRERYVDPVP